MVYNYLLLLQWLMRHKLFGASVDGNKQKVHVRASPLFAYPLTCQRTFTSLHSECLGRTHNSCVLSSTDIAIGNSPQGRRSRLDVMKKHPMSNGTDMIRSK